MVNKTIALVDGDIVVYRAAAAVEKAVDWNGDGVYTYTADIDAAKDHYTQAMQIILSDLKADDYRIAFTGSENFRKEVFPAYKAKRSRKPLVFADLRQWVIDNADSKLMPALEADDILGIWMTLTTGPLASMRKVCVSLDKDLLTVPGIHYNMASRTIEHVSEERAIRKFLMQVLTGDAVDNYPGCPGIGPKTAEKILDIGEDATPSRLWAAIVKTYEKKGLTEADALVQARCARILWQEDYNFTEGKPILWTPPAPE